MGDSGERNDKASGETAARVRPVDAVHNVGAFTSDLVHALRNPVAALMTSVDLLTGGHADADDTKQLHRVMRNELAKLNEMLAHCRELYRLSSIELLPRDFLAILRARVETHRGDFTGRDVRVVLEVPDGEFAILADEEQLGLALDALLINAADAMPDGGELTVSVARDDARREAVLTVKDSGPGMPPEILRNVFRLFYTTRKGAPGLGLPLSRNIFLAHGGTLALASEVGRGTVATVRLPARG